MVTLMPPKAYNSMIEERNGNNKIMKHNKKRDCFC